MKVLVAIHTGRANGIDAYAEHVAASAAAAGVETTLLVSSARVAAALRLRLPDEVAIVDADVPEPSRGVAFAERGLPGLFARRLSKAIARAIGRRGEVFDAVHLNRPFLAPTFRAHGRRIFVAAAAVSCPPPVRLLGDARERPGAADGRSVRLLVCSGDLAHPRKNLRLAGARRGDIRDAAERRFGAAAIGPRLVRIWAGEI